MKEITITGKKIRRELIVLAICMVVVTIWNAYAITTYDTSWSELYSLWYVLLPLSILLYIILLPIRWIVCFTFKRVSKKS